MASPRVQFIVNALKLFEDLTLDSIIPLFTEDYTHIVAPSSVHSVLPPSFNLESFKANLVKLAGVIKGFHYTPLDIVDDEKQNRVTVVLTNEMKFRKEVKDSEDEEDWVHKGEYVFIFTLDETGQKVKHVFEFADPIGMEKLKTMIVKAYANLEKKQKN